MCHTVLQDPAFFRFLICIDQELAAATRLKPWRHPFAGLEIRFGASTLERWFYAARNATDPVQALRNQVRRDIGRFPGLSAEAAHVVVIVRSRRAARRGRGSDGGTRHTG